MLRGRTRFSRKRVAHHSKVEVEGAWCGLAQHGFEARRPCSPEANNLLPAVFAAGQTKTSCVDMLHRRGKKKSVRFSPEAPIKLEIMRWA